MKFKVIVLHKYFYEYEFVAETKEEAEWIAKRFFSIKDEREEHFRGSKTSYWGTPIKNKNQT